MSALERQVTTRKTSECPVESVVVFNDRAEVTRKVELTLTKGMHSVVMEGLPDAMDSDSVRVKGTGNITIVEVSYGVNKKMQQEVDPEKKKSKMEELQEKLQSVGDRKRAVERQRERVKHEEELVRGFLSNCASGTREGKEGAKDKTVDVEVMRNVIEFCGTRRGEEEKALREVREELRKLGEEENGLRAEMAKLGGPVAVRCEESREVTCVVEAKEDTEVRLDVVYRVRNASWSPSYDVRVSSSEGKFALTYFGEVRQNTGEDWKQAKLILSTTSPCKPGAPPVLGTKEVRYKHETLHLEECSLQQNLNAMALRSERFEALSDCAQLRVSAPAAPAPPPPRATVATAKVVGGGGGAAAATFEIARPSTIDSDNKAHKVTIGIMDLNSTFIHYTVPAVAPVAYLQTRTQNTSPYPLLPSSKVHVFLDGSMLATTSMKSVSPGEWFHSFLGEDPSVRIDARPVKKTHSSKGMLSRVESTLYEYLTVVKNAKKIPVNLAVAQQLPLSNDSKIVVTMVQPRESEVVTREGEDEEVLPGEQGWEKVSLNKTTNNITWNKTLTPSSEVKLCFSYTIEYPADKQRVEIV